MKGNEHISRFFFPLNNSHKWNARVEDSCSMAPRCLQKGCENLHTLSSMYVAPVPYSPTPGIAVKNKQVLTAHILISNFYSLSCFLQLPIFFFHVWPFHSSPEGSSLRADVEDLYMLRVTYIILACCLLFVLFIIFDKERISFRCNNMIQYWYRLKNNHHSKSTYA